MDPSCWPDHGEHPEELSAPSRVQVAWARAWSRSRAWGDRRQQPFHLLSDPLLQDPRCQLPRRQGRGQRRRRRCGRGPGKRSARVPRLRGGPAPGLCLPGWAGSLRRSPPGGRSPGVAAAGRVAAAGQGRDSAAGPVSFVWRTALEPAGRLRGASAGRAVWRAVCLPCPCPALEENQLAGSGSRRPGRRGRSRSESLQRWPTSRGVRSRRFRLRLPLGPFAGWRASERAPGELPGPPGGDAQKSLQRLRHQLPKQNPRRRPARRERSDGVPELEGPPAADPGWS